MDTTSIQLHSRYTVSSVDPRVFGGFLEHMGRAVYDGLYNPGSSHADQNGFRSDVLNALRRLRFTAMRYPGGNFASGYHWMDGIGPREKRPVIRDLAWQSLESNQIGTDEFVCLSRQMGWDPMMTVNLGTGTPEEARNWVEYCNCPAGIELGMLALRKDEFGLGLFKSNAPPGQVNVIGLKMPTEEIAKVRARLPGNMQVLEDNPHYLEFRDPYQITWQIMLLERKFSTAGEFANRWLKL